MQWAPIAGILIAERKSDKFNLGTPRNAARRGRAARARTSTQSGFWVPLKGRQRLELAPGPLLRGVGGYGPDPISEKRFQKRKRISTENKSDFYLSLSNLLKIPFGICEEKDHYLSSDTDSKGFSHGKTNSQCQHTNHRKLHS